MTKSEEELILEFRKLQQENADLKAELKRWKRLAGWLASCHAATLESLPKSAARHLRKRCTSICRQFVAFFHGTWEPRTPLVPNLTQEVEREVERCHNAAEKYGVEEKK